MGRPDQSKERIDQILDAFEVCVVRHGLERTTLQMVAEEASVARALIRHYLGNRDSVLIALVKRTIESYHAQLDLLMTVLPKRNRARKLVHYLFQSNRTEADQVLDVVVANSSRHDECQKLVAAFIQHMTDVLTVELVRAYPKAKVGDCFRVASGVACMSMAAESLGSLPLPKKYSRAWEKAAQCLVETLV